MAFDAAAMMAVFVNQMAQAPVAVQCTQAAQESWVKWLLQFALSIVPVAGGVGIAIWSFRATSRRDHERWVLDQKKAEWREMLTIFDEVGERCFPPYKRSDTVDMLIGRAQDAPGRLHGITTRYIFIGRSNYEMSIQFDEFVKTLADGSERLESLRFSKRAEIRIPEEHNSLRDTFQNLVFFAKNSANLDLGIWKIAKNGLIVPTVRDRKERK
jgi:hypothetical protein